MKVQLTNIIVCVYRQEDMFLLDKQAESDKEFYWIIRERAKRILFSCSLMGRCDRTAFMTKMAQVFNLQFNSASNQELRLSIPQISQMEVELNKLDYSRKEDLQWNTEESDVIWKQFREHLKDNLKSLREAFTIAKAKKAVLVIS